MACSDSGPAGPAAIPVAQVVVTAPVTELQLGDSAQLSITVTAADGSPLTDRVVTLTSGDPSVLRVSAAGMVTGVGAGTTSVSASVEGRAANVSLTVQPWNIADNVAVVDSSTLLLVSDSADRAAGLLRFDVLQTPAPAFPVGTIVVGAQSGGFLRRVTSASAAGGFLTLETEPAAIADAVEAGGFASSINLIFAPGTSQAAMGAAAAAAAPGTVLWGEGRFHYLAPGLSLAPGITTGPAAGLRSAGFDLSGLDVCKLLAAGTSAGGSACPQQLKKLEIKSGRLDFEPAFDVEADFAGFSLESFRGVVEGALTADFALLLEAEGQLGEFKATPTFFTFTRPFLAFIGGFPVVGYVELALTGELSIKATAKAAFEAGFEASGSVEVGAEYDGNWNAIIDGTASFEPRLPSVEDGTLTGTIEVVAKVSMKPRVQMIFYGVIGPFAQAEPFGQATLAFGTTCGFSTKMALNAAIGFTIPFLDSKVGDFAHKEEPLLEGPSSDWPCPLGTIDVSTVTNGQNTDEDGYTILVGAESKGTIEPNGQLTATFVEVGEREVSIAGVAGNCVVQGDATRTVTVTTGGLHAVDFVIDCTALTGEIEITTNTSGAAPDPDGYTVRIDGSSSTSIGTNETLVFENVAEGTHTIALSGIESNCDIVGANSVDVDVVADETAEIAFAINCAATELVVRTSTSGPPASTVGWAITLDGADSRTIAPNGQVTYTTTPGQHNVALNGLPDNCESTEPNPVVVDVAGAGSTEHTFNVQCQGAGLNVSVTTDGDPEEGLTYEVVVDDTITSTVEANGSATFADLARGSHTVELRGMLDNCVVEGLNPRSVTAPGTVDFAVTCQQVEQCTAAPVPELTEIHDLRPAGGSVTGTADAAWGVVSASATAASPAAPPGGQSYSGSALTSAQFYDHLFLVPVDPARVGEAVTLRVHVSGDATTAGEVGGDNWSAQAVFGGWSWQSAPWDAAAKTFDEVVDSPRLLGYWMEFDGQATTSVDAHDGRSTSASASIKVERLVDVIDANGITVPIRQICTASGTVYPQ
jgi:hypothetical protein